MSIVDIARLAGCSTATVSRVVNNQKGVSEETRAHVQKIIDDNNFQINIAARNLVKQKANTILFVYDNVKDNPFYAELVHGAIVGAEEAHQILLFNTTCDKHIADYFVKLIDSEQVDGVIIVVSPQNPLIKEFAFRVSKKNLPVILLNETIDELSLPSIHVNDEQASYLATRHLIENGHTRIAFIGSKFGHARHMGYLRAMGNAGLLSEAEIYSAFGCIHRSDATKLTEKLLDMEAAPTAIFASSDNFARGVYDAAEKRKLIIPDDLSVVGYDDVEASATMKPPLTTIHQPIFEMGRRSIQMLLDNVENNGGNSESIVLSAYLVERESVTKI